MYIKTSLLIYQINDTHKVGRTILKRQSFHATMLNIIQPMIEDIWEECLSNAQAMKTSLQRTGAEIFGDIIEVIVYLILFVITALNDVINATLILLLKSFVYLLVLYI